MTEQEEGKRTIVEEVAEAAEILAAPAATTFELAPGLVARLDKVGVRQALEMARIIKPGLAKLLASDGADGAQIVIDVMTAIEPDEVIRLIEVMGKVKIGADQDISLDACVDFFKAWMRVNTVASLKKVIASSLGTAD